MVRREGFRERAEEFERATFSTWAVLSVETKGRDRHEDPDPLRTVFQVDAHRILRSRAFARLGGKAAPVGTTRLALTLEAARLAETLARALRVNADLARAVALGHGVGAPPFGMAGIRALQEFGYDLAEQSVRIVERLERDGAGLNLTWETRDGMLTVEGKREPATVEGQVARLAVQIAEGTLDPPLQSRAARAAREVLGDEVQAWGDRLALIAAQSSADRPEVLLTERAQDVLGGLRTASLERVRADRSRQAEEHRAVHCLQSLAIYALEHGGASAEGHVRRRVVDELAARTDQEAISAYRARFEPRS